MRSNKELIDFLDGKLSRLLAFSRSAESRLSVVLPMSTAMLGTLSFLTDNLTSWTVVYAIAASFAVFFLVSCIACAILSVFPRTRGPKGSLIYFEGIASLEREQYSNAVKNLTDEQHIEDLLNQCHRIAEVAGKKYKWIQWSMIALCLATVPWTVALFVLTYQAP